MTNHNVACIDMRHDFIPIPNGSAYISITLCLKQIQRTQKTGNKPVRSATLPRNEQRAMNNEQ